jgi:hypothetical protein
MSAFFGPEIPVPHCINSERDMRKDLDGIFGYNEQRLNERRKAGEWSQLDYYSSMDYENKMCHAVSKYLDIGCNDEILYIRARGDEDPSTNKIASGDTSYVDIYSNTVVKDWPKIFHEQFALVKHIDVCEVSVNEQFVEPTEDMLEVERMEAELKPRFKFTFIREHSQKPQSKHKKYDKIIIKNCLKYFERNEKCFASFILDYFKEPIQAEASLLIMQRVSDLNTLPFQTNVRRQWHASDVKYTKFMEVLQNEYYSIRYDIELFDFIIDCKSSWYKSLKDRALYPLNQDSLLVDRRTVETRKELIHGLRELNEGVFKYLPMDEYVELSDRILFIGAHHDADRKVKLAERIKLEKQKKRNYTKQDDVEIDREIRKLYLEITPDLRPIVNSIPKFSRYMK